MFHAAVLKVCVSKLSDWQGCPPRSLMTHTHSLHINIFLETHFQLPYKINSKTRNYKNVIMLNQAETNKINEYSGILVGLVN